MEHKKIIHNVYFFANSMNVFNDARSIYHENIEIAVISSKAHSQQVHVCNFLYLFFSSEGVQFE